MSEWGCFLPEHLPPSLDQPHQAYFNCLITGTNNFSLYFVLIFTKYGQNAKNLLFRWNQIRWEATLASNSPTPAHSPIVVQKSAVVEETGFGIHREWRRIMDVSQRRHEVHTDPSTHFKILDPNSLPEEGVLTLGNKKEQWWLKSPPHIRFPKDNLDHSSA